MLECKVRDLVFAPSSALHFITQIVTSESHLLRRNCMWVQPQTLEVIMEIVFKRLFLKMCCAANPRIVEQSSDPRFVQDNPRIVTI